MKRTIFILMSFAFSIYAQEDNMPELRMTLSINYPSRSVASTTSNSGEKNGYLNGTIFTNNENSTGVSVDCTFSSFLGALPEIYWYHKKHPDETITEAKRAELYKNEKWLLHADSLTVQYQLYPGKYKMEDTVINFYLRYIVYKKKKDINDFKANYDISFHEAFFTCPIGRDYQFDYFKAYLPFASIIIKLEIGPVPEKKEIFSEQDNVIDIRQTILVKDDILKYSESAKVNQPGLKLSLEYVMTNKNNDEILTRKMDYPMQAGTMISTEKEIIQLNKTIYKGTISVPFEIFNKEKEILFKRSTISKELKNYHVYVMPIEKVNNRYSFQILVINNIRETGSFRSQNIVLAPGEKYKIILKNGDVVFKETIEGERLTISTKEDYEPFVNDFLLIGFEK